MSNIITIHRANDHRLTFSLSSGATGVTAAYFTVKLFTDTATDDDDALIAKTCTVNVVGDALTGYVDLSHDDTDITEKAYKYDFKLKYATTYVNVEQGVLVIKERITIREP